ncbi:MAG: hypothetical protein GX879_08425 [Bacteroidales bacterium]|nr:hypothetical protein [Bacteroidales bacterium]
MEQKSYVEILEFYDWKFPRTEDDIVEKTEYDLYSALASYFPENAIDDVVAMLKKYPINVKIAPRVHKMKACEGKFRYNYFEPHIIWLKKGLTKDDYLRVFLHEYAHLLTQLAFPRVTAHGWEFSFCFNELIRTFINKNIISKDVYLSYFDFRGSKLDFYLSKKELELYDLHEHIEGELGRVKKKFRLKSLRVGSKFRHKDEVYLRGKGKQDNIYCPSVSGGAKLCLKFNTLVEPVLDLNW